MKNSEDKDPVWDLLKQARKHEPSPFFARNVVREVRKLDSEPSWTDRLSDLFRSRFAVTGAVAAIGLTAVFLAVWSPDTKEIPPVVVVEEEAFDPANELEAVEYLGQLMAVADPGQLTDEALGDLFF